MAVERDQLLLNDVLSTIEVSDRDFTTAPTRVGSSYSPYASSFAIDPVHQIAERIETNGAGIDRQHRRDRRSRNTYRAVSDGNLPELITFAAIPL